MISLFQFLHTYTPSAVLFELGPIQVYWYGFFYAVSIALGYWIIERRLKKLEGGAALVERLPDLTLKLVFVGLLGGRLYHVLNEWQYYWQQPSQIVAIWNGGMAIHGAIIAGLLFLWRYAKKTPRPLFFWLDLIAPVVLLGQAIGRWGNYFNQELYGYPTSLPWGIPIDVAHRLPGFENFSHFHPTFLYEFLWDFVAALCLLAWQKRRPETMGRGYIFVTYLLVMFMGRTLTELFRIDPTPFILGLRLPLFLSFLGFTAAILGLSSLLSRKR